MSSYLLGLLGSGEFEPWSDAVDQALLSRARPGNVLILPTASAQDGAAAFDDWGEKGLAHYHDLGVDAEVVPLKTRADAEDLAHAKRLAGAAIVFFSGGNPAYLVETLAGSRFWSALLPELANGLAYAGCSAGAMILGEETLDNTKELGDPGFWRPGLGLLPATYIGPHWDALDGYVPGLRDAFSQRVVPNATLLTVDESTAIVSSDDGWQVIGRGTAGIQRGSTDSRFSAGESFAS